MQYKIMIEGDTLVFSTGSFLAEDVSALHKGIYTNEHTASLVAGALTLGVVVVINALGIDLSLAHVLLAVVFFVSAFIFLRRFVFYEAILTAVLDRKKGRVEVITKQFFKQKVSFDLAGLEGVEKGYKIITPKNPDGVEMVKKLAAQHGQVIPGFGEVNEYHTVSFSLKDGSRIMVYSVDDPDSAEEVVEKLTMFIGGVSAETD